MSGGAFNSENGYFFCKDILNLSFVANIFGRKSYHRFSVNFLEGTICIKTVVVTLNLSEIPQLTFPHHQVYQGSGELRRQLDPNISYGEVPACCSTKQAVGGGWGENDVK